jgi:hypothetical protein
MIDLSKSRITGSRSDKAQPLSSPEYLHSATPSVRALAIVQCLLQCCKTWRRAGCYVLPSSAHYSQPVAGLWDLGLSYEVAMRHLLLGSLITCAIFLLAVALVDPDTFHQWVLPIDRLVFAR